MNGLVPSELPRYMPVPAPMIVLPRMVQFHVGCAVCRDADDLLIGANASDDQVLDRDVVRDTLGFHAVATKVATIDRQVA